MDSIETKNISGGDTMINRQPGDLITYTKFWEETLVCFPLRQRALHIKQKYFTGSTQTAN
jgi:hypothetical protein